MRWGPRTLLAFVFAILPSMAIAPISGDSVHAQVQPLGVDIGYDGQWGLQLIHANEVWAITTGSGITVAVIDSGSGPNPDLSPNILPGRSFMRGRIGDDAADIDPLGHGTHVAGIIAAQANNDIGIAGIAPDARILPVRILDASGDGSESDLALGIRYAVDQGVRVINLSLGGNSQTAALQAALQYAAERSVLVVAAAGNGGPTSDTTYPAGNDLTLAVTAIDQTSNAASFTQRGDYIDLAAPGVSICSTVRSDIAVNVKTTCAGADSPYNLKSGTSMAAAFVSGLAALMFSARPTLTAVQAREVLIATATDLGEPGRDTTFGAGLINAYEVFLALGYFADAIVYPTVSSLGRIGKESLGLTPKLPAIQRFQWYRCLTPGEATVVFPDHCTPIARAQQSTYIPLRRDIGSFLRFTTLISIAGTPEIRFSATTPRITGVWTSLTAIEVGKQIALKQLVQSASKGNRSMRLISGPCTITRTTTLIAKQLGTCKLRIVVDAKAPYPRLVNTVEIMVFPRP